MLEPAVRAIKDFARTAGSNKQLLHPLGNKTAPGIRIDVRHLRIASKSQFELDNRLPFRRTDVRAMTHAVATLNAGLDPRVQPV